MNALLDRGRKEERTEIKITEMTLEARLYLDIYKNIRLSYLINDRISAGGA